jgi:hypothetical protein
VPFPLHSKYYKTLKCCVSQPRQETLVYSICVTQQGSTAIHLVAVSASGHIVTSIVSAFLPRFRRRRLATCRTARAIEIGLTIGPQIFERAHVAQFTNRIGNIAIEIVLVQKHGVQIDEISQLGWHRSREFILINNEFSQTL